MPQRDNEGAESTSRHAEGLEETRRIVEKYSPRSPYLDNIHGHKGLAELDKVRDWAREMEKCGHSISGIRRNPDDPPDVLADIDGRPIGIEVTDLMVYPSPKEPAVVCFATADGEVTIMKWWWRRNGSFDFRWHGVELGSDEKAEWERKVKANPRQYQGRGVEWTLDLFQTQLAAIVKKKDKKAARKKRELGEAALDSGLRGSFLLIFTPEFYLQACLAEYLEKTTVLRPENFDRIFAMGYAPRDGRPVFEVRLTSASGCRVGS